MFISRSKYFDCNLYLTWSRARPHAAWARRGGKLLPWDSDEPRSSSRSFRCLSRRPFSLSVDPHLFRPPEIWLISFDLFWSRVQSLISYEDRATHPHRLVNDWLWLIATYTLRYDIILSSATRFYIQSIPTIVPLRVCIFCSSVPINLNNFCAHIPLRKDNILFTITYKCSYSYNIKLSGIEMWLTNTQCLPRPLHWPGRKADWQANLQQSAILIINHDRSGWRGR